MDKRISYETPRICVRGVFLLDGVMDVVSTDNRVTQDGWTDGGTLKATNRDTNEDDVVWLLF
jgi:hypothetical protein